MTERALRDQLEQHQVAIKALEAELALAHAPQFLAKRAELSTQLQGEKRALEEAKTRLTAALAGQAEAKRVVEVLDARGRSANQRSLDLLPLVLLSVSLCVGASFVKSLEQVTLIGFAASALLGFGFGPRVVEWALPGQRRDPLAPGMTETLKDRGVMLLGTGSSFMLLGLLAATLVHVSFWKSVSESASFWSSAGDFDDSWQALVGGAAAILGSATLLSLRAAHVARAQGPLRVGPRLQGGLGLVTLASLAVTVLPRVRDALGGLGRVAGYGWWNLLFSLSAVLLPLVAFVPLAVAAWRGPAQRPWRLGLALGCAVMPLLLAYGATQRPTDGLNSSAVAGLAGAVQLGGLALVAAASGDLSSWPRARLATVLAAVASLAAAAYLVFG